MRGADRPVWPDRKAVEMGVTLEQVGGGETLKTSVDHLRIKLFFILRATGSH